MEVIDSVMFGQLIMNFEARLEKIFKQLKFFRFPVRCWHRCVSDLGNLEILLILLWKFAEMLLFANCWRANKIRSASLVAGLFSLRNYG